MRIAIESGDKPAPELVEQLSSLQDDLDAMAGESAMSKYLQVFLGVLTAVGGFVDIGDLVTNGVAGSRFGMSLAWAVVLGCDRHRRLRGDVRTGRGVFRSGGVRPGAGTPRAHVPRWRT
ncbi:MAG: hypothetical protein V9G10_03200 [Candidatus Nanopelagicales bacterium]